MGVLFLLNLYIRPLCQIESKAFLRSISTAPAISPLLICQFISATSFYMARVVAWFCLNPNCCGGIICFLIVLKFVINLFIILSNILLVGRSILVGLKLSIDIRAFLISQIHFFSFSRWKSLAKK